MRKSWLHRLLLSYLPVFILFVCLFLFIGVIQLNSLSRQDAVKSSRAFARNLESNLDMSLRSIEMMMIGTVTRNSTLTSFAGMESSPEFIIGLSQLLQCAQRQYGVGATGPHCRQMLGYDPSDRQAGSGPR